MGLAAGDLDREIEIWRDVEGDENDLGEKPVTPTIIGRPWAGMNLFSRAERLAAAQMSPVLGQKFTVRREDVAELQITTKDRVRYNGIDYRINNVCEAPRLEAVEIFVSGMQD